MPAVEERFAKGEWCRFVARHQREYFCGAMTVELDRECDRGALRGVASDADDGRRCNPGLLERYRLPFWIFETKAHDLAPAAAAKRIGSKSATPCD